MYFKQTKRRIASVVLNYNSDADVMVSVPQLLAQKNVDHTIIIVDNASNPECVQRLKVWLQSVQPNVVIGSPDEVIHHIRNEFESAHEFNQIYFVLNHENRGYSAGNNIGISLADVLVADAVMIANPDMRIDDPHYIAELSKALFANDKNCIAASRIHGLDGKEQNPLREASFWEEFFWPRFYLSKIFGKPISYILPIEADVPVPVPKVSGCCLMFDMAFLRATDYLDENTFLYCEEPILSAKVQKQNGCIILAPTLLAVHAHEKSKKDNSSRRMLLFINSRKYYLRHYSKYGLMKRLLLCLSYTMLAMFHRAKSLIC